MTSESAIMTDVVQQPTKPPPEPELDIFQLCQRGRLSEVVKLVEDGADIKERDAENITCLHWAAINNRTELCAYLIDQGAEVDALGGELMATPMQWAVRYGHLETTVLLSKRGADPLVADCQGYNSLHLATQFNFPTVVGYLIASGVEVDVKDTEGHTSLMWSAMKVFDPDMTRLLLALGASPNAQDAVENTALHYALAASNVNSAMVLVDKGASYEIRNDQGKSAQDYVYGSVLAMKNPMMFSDMIPPARKATSFIDTLHQEPLRRNILLCIPFFGLCGIGFALEMLFVDLIKGFVTLFAVAIMWGQVYGIMSEDAGINYNWPGPMAVYLGTKVMMFLTFFYKVFPYTQGPDALVGYTWDMTAVCFSVGLWYFFYKAHTHSPGYVAVGNMKSTRQQIVSLAESGMLSKNNFCFTCAVRKPYRSKHCPFTGRCVAKFDHYCPFTGNAIGANNHRYFMLFLICMPATIITYLILCVLFLQTECDVADSYVTMLFSYISCQPWICWTMANGAMHATWVTCLLSMQLKQIAEDLTTNESINQWKYEYLHHGSPWSNGCIRNVLNFFAGDPTDWTQVYTLPK